MSCDVYRVGSWNLRFSDADDTTRCLCTFDEDQDVLTEGQLRSLALLGAATRLYHNREPSKFTDSVLIPGSLPDWIDRQIREATEPLRIMRKLSSRLAELIDSKTTDPELKTEARLAESALRNAIAALAAMGNDLPTQEA